MNEQAPKKVKKRLAIPHKQPNKAQALAASGPDAALKADVQAFASQLGLAAPGIEASGFDDRDFRPEAASKTVGKADGKVCRSHSHCKYDQSHGGPSCTVSECRKGTSLSICRQPMQAQRFLALGFDECYFLADLTTSTD